jgi:hypothetical protein
VVWLKQQPPPAAGPLGPVASRMPEAILSGTPLVPHLKPVPCLASSMEMDGDILPPALANISAIDAPPHMAQSMAPPPSMLNIYLVFDALNIFWACWFFFLYIIYIQA